MSPSSNWVRSCPANFGLLRKGGSRVGNVRRGDRLGASVSVTNRSRAQVNHMVSVPQPLGLGSPSLKECVSALMAVKRPKMVGTNHRVTAFGPVVECHRALVLGGKVCAKWGLREGPLEAGLGS